MTQNAKQMIVDQSKPIMMFCIIIGLTLNGCNLFWGTYWYFGENKRSKNLAAVEMPEYSKFDTFRAMNCLLYERSEFQIPETIKHEELRSFYSDRSSNSRKQYFSDSINFHLFVPTEHDTLLLWCRIGRSEWTDPSMIFLKKVSVLGYSNNNWLGTQDREYKRSMGKRGVELFQSTIVPNVQTYLKNPCLQWR